MRKNTKLAKKVGSNIKNLRITTGLTQTELGERIGNKSQSAIYHYERGDVIPDIITLIRITRIFGITVDEIVTFNYAIKNKERN